jgi:hypothetical protein
LTPTARQRALARFDRRPLLSGGGRDPRKEFFCRIENSDLAGLRYASGASTRPRARVGPRSNCRKTGRG